MKRMLDWLKKSKVKKLYTYVREELEDQKLNRQLIGIDRDGNKYFQYYSYWGLPTRREIRFKLSEDIQIRDLVYYNWLHKIDPFPPSEAEKIKFYEEERLRFQRGRQWDEREEILLQEFRRKREQIQLRNLALKILADQMKEELQLSFKRNQEKSQQKNIKNQKEFQNEISQKRQKNKKQQNDTKNNEMYAKNDFDYKKI